MQLALRPYATAGVALVGASVIAVSPVIATPTAIEQVRDDAVALSAWSTRSMPSVPFSRRPWRICRS